MAKGRKPKDPALKELAGNPGKRPIAAAAKPADPVDEEFPPPPRLIAEERTIWRETVALLSHAGLAKHTDFAALEVYVTTYVRWDKCRRKLNAHGFTYTTPSGYTRARPEVAIVEKAERILASYQDRLGLNTAARVRTGSILAGRQLGLPLTGGGTKPAGEDRSGAAPPQAQHDDPVGFIAGHDRVH